MNDSVLYNLDGHVATITYNRPDALNAINREMRRGLNEAFTRFRDEEDAWVAIVTGAGKAFCAGADLRDGGGATGEFAGTFWEKPTINSFESGLEGSDIHGFGDALFFSTVQILTVSSSAKNPVTHAGQIVDVALEFWAIFVVTAIAGSFASFFSSGDQTSG